MNKYKSLYFLSNIINNNNHHGLTAVIATIYPSLWTLTSSNPVFLNISVPYYNVISSPVSAHIIYKHNN